MEERQFHIFGRLRLDNIVYSHYYTARAKITGLWELYRNAKFQKADVIEDGLKVSLFRF